MQYHNHPTVPFYRFESLADCTGVRHAVLTRGGGVSPAPWSTLNLGWTIGDEDQNVEANYRLWTRVQGVERTHLTTTWQVHGSRVMAVDRTQRGEMIGKADGIITDCSLLPLVQRYADCTPILAYDPVRHACGIAHAGWRGTVARCTEALIQALVEHYDSRPSDIVATVGPAIGPCCYEVGEEVIAAIMSSQQAPQDLIIASDTPGHAYLDLWEANARQFRDAGVGNVEVANLCTVCNRHHFFSHRGDQGRTGRFAAYIMLVS